jgi:CDP-glycerol glycerophosphotransferase (TagB/SpsB family)
VVCGLDRVVPKSDRVVVRTFPDLDDQGRELVAALVPHLAEAPVWLVEDPAAAPTNLGVRFVGTRSLAGIVAFWRARVVVHTHGIFGAHRCSRQKRFVNLWHGMPVKRLPADSEVGRNQTDVTIATSEVHASHLAETWGLRDDQVRVTGLPRNDVLVRPRPAPSPWLAERLRGRPHVLWLPTFRSTVIGPQLTDGVDLGTETQFAGADLATVDALMGDLGLHCTIKPHPLAAPPAAVDLPNVSVLGEGDLARVGHTLYELLATADVLVTDHSSVWIDHLLTGRPVVFAVSDLDEYAAGRGYYFDDLVDLLPGPVVRDVDGLREALAALAGGDDPWQARREAARALHHRHVDDGSAARVAAVVLEQLERRRS